MRNNCRGLLTLTKRNLYQAALTNFKPDGKLDYGTFKGKTTEEVLTLIYLPRAGEALDAFDMAELLRKLARIANAEPDPKA